MECILTNLPYFSNIINSPAAFGSEFLTRNFWFKTLNCFRYQKFNTYLAKLLYLFEVLFKSWRGAAIDDIYIFIVLIDFLYWHKVSTFAHNK